jgi:hypothetical protein
MSAPSLAVTLTFPGTCGAVPDAPTRVVVQQQGARVTVSWQPPTSGTAATGYALIVTGNVAGSFPIAGRTVSGVIGPGSYTLRVAAANACGHGPSSAPQTIVVP